MTPHPGISRAPNRWRGGAEGQEWERTWDSENSDFECSTPARLREREVCGKSAVPKDKVAMDFSAPPPKGQRGNVGAGDPIVICGGDLSTTGPGRIAARKKHHKPEGRGKRDGLCPQEGEVVLPGAQRPRRRARPPSPSGLPGEPAADQRRGYRAGEERTSGLGDRLGGGAQTSERDLRFALCRCGGGPATKPQHPCVNAGLEGIGFAGTRAATGADTLGTDERAARIAGRARGKVQPRNGTGERTGRARGGGTQIRHLKDSKTGG